MNNVGLKTRKFDFQKYEVSVVKPKVSVRKPEVSVRKPEVLVQKPEVLVRKPEVWFKIVELETSVKVVFRNASVAETQNFESLY
jgi:hypothetical protein